MRYKAVLFDFDYTLGDATVPIAAAARDALRQMGRTEAPSDEAVRFTVGHTLQDAYTMLTGDKDEAARETFSRLFRAVSQEIQDAVLLPGARELLAHLRAAGVPTAVVSTKGGRHLGGILKQHGLDTLVEFFISGDDVKAPKPDPQGLLLAMGRLGVDGSRTLYVGDTVIDAATARAAGADFAAVTTGTTRACAFADYPAVYVAGSLKELKTWLFQ